MAEFLFEGVELALFHDVFAEEFVLELEEAFTRVDVAGPQLRTLLLGGAIFLIPRLQQCLDLRLPLPSPEPELGLRA